MGRVMRYLLMQRHLMLRLCYPADYVFCKAHEDIVHDFFSLSSILIRFGILLLLESSKYPTVKVIN
jgi:hypothetical protein